MKVLPSPFAEQTTSKSLWTGKQCEYEELESTYEGTKSMKPSLLVSGLHATKWKHLMGSKGYILNSVNDILCVPLCMSVYKSVEFTSLSVSFG